MTAEDFADLVGARLVSRGKWIVRCPAHGGYSGGLIVTEGFKGVAKVECLERCPTTEIRKSLRLTRHEFECWPAPLPDFFEMSDDEHRTFHAEQIARQARHAAACERIRALQAEVKSIRKEIHTCSHNELLQDLKTNLDKAEQKLSAARTREVKLRDLDPSFRLWDAEPSYSGSVRTPWTGQARLLRSVKRGQESFRKREGIEDRAGK
jgi:hypothetical protein